MWVLFNKPWWISWLKKMKILQVMDDVCGIEVIDKRIHNDM